MARPRRHHSDLVRLDVLAVEGLPTTMLPYAGSETCSKARPRESARLVATFEDGEALFAAVCERGLKVSPSKRDLYGRATSVGEDEEPCHSSLAESRGHRTST
jgi:hypothetical protein